MQHFLHGLQRNVVEEIVKDPAVNTYEEMKAKAIATVRALRLISEMFRGRGNRGQAPTSTSWQARWQPNRPPQPQYRQGGFSQPQYNSSTAPPSWADHVVPMDLDRTRAPRGNWRGQSRGRGRGAAYQQGQRTQGRVFEVGDRNWDREQRLKEGTCFLCGKKGHFACACPTQRGFRPPRAQSNLIDFDPYEGSSQGESEHTTWMPPMEIESQESKIARLYTEMNTLSAEEGALLMARAGQEKEEGGTGFPSA